MSAAGPTARARRESALLVLTVGCAALLLAGTAGAAREHGKVLSVKAGCAGDLISGRATVSAPAILSLQLLSRRSARARFLATRKLAWIRARKAGSYKFSFDISKLKAQAYRVRAKSGARSAILPAATCAPGYQVPEAPFALLLPLSLLLAGGVVLALRRLRQRFAVRGA